MKCCYMNFELVRNGGGSGSDYKVVARRDRMATELRNSDGPSD
jgi:hypothetical protein